MSATITAQQDRMQCMEVWGGNSPVERSFYVPGLEVAVYSRPFEQAEGGGDVYYVSSCASGRITRLLLADVSGHGEVAANAAVSLRDLMRRNVNVINQTSFVREINQQFCGQPGQSQFATALVCTFFAPTRSLQFSNAGHPLPLLFREGCWASAAEFAAVQRGDGVTDVPLGVTGEASYSRYQLNLSPREMVLCVSDSFTESRTASGKMLGTDGLIRLIGEIDASEPAEIIQQLVARIADLHEGNLQEDDTTAVLFRADGSTSSFANNLLAPLRLLSGVRDTTGIH